MGSPFYMSPEQMRSAKDVTPQSDIWALGIVLHELLSGQTPFFGETFPEVCLKIGTGTVSKASAAGGATAATQVATGHSGLTGGIAADSTAIYFSTSTALMKVAK